MELKEGDLVAFVHWRCRPDYLAIRHIPFGRIVRYKSGRHVMTVSSIAFTKTITPHADRELVRYWVPPIEAEATDLPSYHPDKCWLSRSKQHPGWRARFDHDGEEQEVDIVLYDPSVIYFA
jgi:hypothetical protein